MTREGVVTSIASISCRVDTGDAVYECAARRRLTESDTGETKPVAVGDRVRLEVTGGGEGVLTEVLTRRTKLSRAQPYNPRTEHVIVANVDQVLVVSAVREPPLRVGLIDRYIIAAQVEALDPIVCINKVDLATPEDNYLEVARIYRDLDFPVVLTSARDGTGLEALKGLLCGKTTVLTGHSATGKSSLINAIQPGLELRTAPMGWRGTHCTSTVSLLKLGFGGYIVDTPGIREFNLWDVEKRDVAQFFPEIWEFSHECKMPDCMHVHEPECAVRAALQRGELAPLRYESYVAILESVERLEVPRRTDVEQPDRQVSRRQRRASRRTRKQRMKRWWEEDLGQEKEEEE